MFCVAVSGNQFLLSALMFVGSRMITPVYHHVRCRRQHKVRKFQNPGDARDLVLGFVLGSGIIIV